MVATIREMGLSPNQGTIIKIIILIVVASYHAFLLWTSNVMSFLIFWFVKQTWWYI